MGGYGPLPRALPSLRWWNRCNSCTHSSQGDRVTGDLRIQNIEARRSLEKSSNTEAKFGRRLARAHRGSQWQSSVSESTAPRSLLRPNWCLLPPSLNSSSHAQTTGVQSHLTRPCLRSPFTLWPPGPPSNYHFLADDSAGCRKETQPGASGNESQEATGRRVHGGRKGLSGTAESLSHPSFPVYGLGIISNKHASSCSGANKDLFQDI